MATIFITGEPLDTLTPIADRKKGDLFAKNEIVNEWVLDPSLKQTFNIDLTSLLYGSWKQMNVKNDVKNGTTFEDVPTSIKEQSYDESLQEKIFYKMQFPNHWEQDGINKPNLEAKNNALKICKALTNYSMFPDKILPTKEEGLYITYDSVSETRNRSLIIETYNNAETALVISDNINRKILYSEDINNFDFENAVRIFKETNI